MFQKNDSSLYKGAFVGQGQALSLRYDIEFNLIAADNRHISVNYYGGSKPPPYRVGYIFSIRAKHPLLFTFHSSLPVRTFATALLCLIFAYASYFFACRVNILEYRTHTCQQKNTEMTKNISAIFLLNFKPLTLCLCAAEEPLKFSAFSRPQCRI